MSPSVSICVHPLITMSTSSFYAVIYLSSLNSFILSLDEWQGEPCIQLRTDQGKGLVFFSFERACSDLSVFPSGNGTDYKDAGSDTCHYLNLTKITAPDGQHLVCANSAQCNWGSDDLWNERTREETPGLLGPACPDHHIHFAPALLIVSALYHPIMIIWNDTKKSRTSNES